MPSGKYNHIRRHMETKTPLYQMWLRIKTRCLNSKAPNFIWYGERGIKVCDEWENNFFAFKKWALENGWKAGLSIERHNVNGNYEPNNCGFATPKLQARNRTNNIIVEYDGVKKCLAEWAEYFQLNYDLVLIRYKRGMPLQKVFHKGLLRKPIL